MAQTKRQIAVLLKEKAKDQTSGIVPRSKPVDAPDFSTPGLGAARFNLRTIRGDSLPKTKRGSR